MPQPLVHRDIGRSNVRGTVVTIGTGHIDATDATAIGPTDATAIGPTDATHTGSTHAISATDATTISASLPPSYPTQTGVTGI